MGYNLTFDGNGGKCSDEGENSGKEKIVLEKIHHQCLKKKT